MLASWGEPATIDNIRHYGYETNKRHLNQASFAPPTKFVNIFVLERKYVLCALNCLAITKAVTTSTHYQRMNLGSSTVMESTGIKHLRLQNSLYGETVQH